MESTTINNSINAIKEVTKLSNDVRNNLMTKQRELEKNSIKKKLYITF